MSENVSNGLVVVVVLIIVVVVVGVDVVVWGCLPFVQINVGSPINATSAANTPVFTGYPVLGIGGIV